MNGSSRAADENHHRWKWSIPGPCGACGRCSSPWCTALLTVPDCFRFTRGRIQRHPGRLPVRTRWGVASVAFARGSIYLGIASLFVDDGADHLDRRDFPWFEQQPVAAGTILRSRPEWRRSRGLISAPGGGDQGKGERRSGKPEGKPVQVVCQRVIICLVTGADRPMLNLAFIYGNGSPSGRWNREPADLRLKRDLAVALRAVSSSISFTAYSSSPEKLLAYI